MFILMFHSVLFLESVLRQGNNGNPGDLKVLFQDMNDRNPWDPYGFQRGNNRDPCRVPKRNDAVGILWDSKTEEYGP